MEQAIQFAVLATKKLWLPVGLILVTVLSAILPVPNDEVTDLINTIDKWSAVTVAFICGLCISTRTLFNYASRPRIHIIVAMISMIAIPVLTEVVTYVLTVTNVIESDDFVEGLIITTCLPASFRTTVILTLDGFGNEACAILSVVLSKYLSIFVTPFLITVLMGSAELNTVRESLWGVNSTLLGPLILGHVVQRLIDFKNDKNIPLASILKVILILNYYVAASQVSHELEIYTPLEMIVMLITVTVVMTIVKVIIGKVSDELKLDPEARNATAIMYASTHKSLRCGIVTLKDTTAVPCALWLYFVSQVMVGCFISLLFKLSV